MSNFRIKKPVKHYSNIKDSNTLEIKHRQKIKQIDMKKHSLDKLNQQLNKATDELSRIDLNRKDNATIDLEKRAKLLNTKQKLEEDIDTIINNMDEM